MATIKTAKPARTFSASIADVVKAVVSYSTSEADLINALKNADTAQEALREAGMAARWFVTDCQDGLRPVTTYDDAMAAQYLALVHGTTSAKRKEGQLLLTEAQAKKHGACRTWWSRMLAKAGVVTTQTRGAKSKGRKPVKATASAAAVGKLSVPKVATLMDASKFMMLETKRLNMFLQANAKPVLNGKPAPAEAYRKCINDFIVAVAKIKVK